MKAVVDSSFLVALLNREDAHHEEARRRYEEHGPQTINQPVLTEFLLYIHFRVRKERGERSGHEAARQALGALVHELRFRVQPLEDQEGAFRVFREQPALSFPDAAGVADALAKAASLWTFDEQQARMHRRLAKARA